MQAGKNILGFSDSTAFCMYDPPDPEPMANLAYPMLIEGLVNVKYNNMSALGAQADFELINGVFCGLRPNANNILAFMRGFGIEILNILLGANDWGQSTGKANYAKSIKAIVGNAVDRAARFLGRK